MKKISTLLLSSLFSLSLLAYDGSRLSISTISNTMNLKIEVDGRRLSMQDNSITLKNIGEGYHQVKIFRDRKNGHGNRLDDNNGNGFGNGFGFGFGRRSQIIYSNSIFLKRGFETEIIVSRSGKVFIDECLIDSYDDFNDDDRNDGNGGWNNGYGNVINTREFEQVKDQIRKEWFEKNRLTSAKVIIEKNNFTARQVTELASLFTFENNKLEIAKYAYRKTVDKQNYYLLNDVFTFNSSKDELARFIRETR